MTIASAAPESTTPPTTSFTDHRPASLRIGRPRHLLAQWHDCRQTAEGLRHADALKRICLRLCEELHLKVAGHAFFQFEPDGVTGTVLLGDSHIALHTWPEHNMLKADIHLRHSGNDAAALVLMERLKACFQPVSSSIAPGRRGASLN
ncbi:MAG TPA: S-adenosylmethionine decarboxylase [Herbaspirillum sp.]